MSSRVPVVSVSTNSPAHCLTISPSALRARSHVCSACRFSAGSFMTVVGSACTVTWECCCVRSPDGHISEAHLLSPVHSSKQLSWRFSWWESSDSEDAQEIEHVGEHFQRVDRPF